MKKILIIEDNYEVRDNLEEILELADYQVVTAENGKIGVEKALEEKPDLILCDVMMPVLDGFGVLKILEQKPATVDIPFIFLTAKGEKSDFRKGMNLGADDYITKPFTHTELMEAIEMRLKKSERLKQGFDRTAQGLNAFMDEARGLKELEKLSDKSIHKTFRKKDFLYQEGSIPKYLYFLISGKIKISRTNDMGKEFISQIHQAGDFIGYTALLSDKKYDENAVVMEDAEISLIPKSDFFLLLHNDKNLAIRFIRILANNAEDKEAQLLSLAYNSIRKRVAEALIKLHDLKSKEDQKSITILRDDLAALVGTAKESVIRTLTDFKKEGLIEINQGKITILKKDTLVNAPW